MKYVSTRHGADAAGFDEAVENGIAPDGGLYVPEQVPAARIVNFDRATTFPQIARLVLQPFMEPSPLAGELGDIIAESMSFPVPTTRLGRRNASLIELFHGPTAAFKDIGAGFLAACITRMQATARRDVTILVATSGDTGAAVAAAFHRRPAARVVVLYPDGRVSDRQAHQLACWGDNVLTLRVQGSFDDCQGLVKSAFADDRLRARYRLNSANSINVARLLPQMTYFAHTALQHHRRTGERPGFIVPTGNLGNGVACLMARQVGMPVGPVILATNANRTVVDLVASGRLESRPSVATLATAMDVGDPSNAERFLRLHPDVPAESAGIESVSVNDEEIRDEIRRCHADAGLALCPHTATASRAFRRLDRARQSSRHWYIVATAHAAKFEQVVEPLIGETVQVPPPLARLLDRPARSVPVEPGLDALASAMDAAFNS